MSGAPERGWPGLGEGAREGGVQAGSGGDGLETQEQGEVELGMGVRTELGEKSGVGKGFSWGEGWELGMGWVWGEEGTC